MTTKRVEFTLWIKVQLPRRSSKNFSPRSIFHCFTESQLMAIWYRGPDDVNHHRPKKNQSSKRTFRHTHDELENNLRLNAKFNRMRIRRLPFSHYFELSNLRWVLAENTWTGSSIDELLLLIFKICYLELSIDYFGTFIDWSLRTCLKINLNFEF